MTPERKAYAELRLRRLRAKLTGLVNIKQIKSTKQAIRRWEKELKAETQD